MQVYAPTSASREEEVEKFYKELNRCKNECKGHELNIVIEDFNPKHEGNSHTARDVVLGGLKGAVLGGLKGAEPPLLMLKIGKFLILLLFFATFCARAQIVILIALHHCIQPL